MYVLTLLAKFAFLHKSKKLLTNAPIAAWKCYTLPIWEIMTDRRTNKTNIPTDQPTDGQEWHLSYAYHKLSVFQVDHLTLDSCLTFTYLSHRARGVHYLNSLLAQVNQGLTQKSLY